MLCSSIMAPKRSPSGLLDSRLLPVRRGAIEKAAPRQVEDVRRDFVDLPSRPAGHASHPSTIEQSHLAPRDDIPPAAKLSESHWRARFAYPTSLDPRSTLELHSIPIDRQNLEARVLRDLPDALSILGRHCGLFDQNEAVQADAFEDRAEATSSGNGNWHGAKGIAAYHDRRVVTWLPLPYGTLGSVFDEEDVKNRLIASLALHANTGLHDEGEVALAVSVEPITMLMVGQAGDIERRSSAQFLYTMAPKSSLRIEPNDSVPASALASQASEIADELTAKLVLRLGSIR